MVQNRNLKSEYSTEKSYIRFVNATGRSVDVIWMNYEGARVKYKTLVPMSCFDVDTYVTHPWVFRDSQSKQQLVVNGKEFVYHPSPSPTPPRRIIVYITIPMYTLKEHCIRMIRNVIHSSSDVVLLNIPQTLKEELVRTWESSYDQEQQR